MPRFPMKHFALYTMGDCRDSIDCAALLHKIHSGIRGRKMDLALDTCVLMGEDDCSDYLKEIKQDHAKVARKHALCEEYFLAVDSAQWWADGVLLVNMAAKATEGYREAIRVEAEIAGEALTWLYIGLATWKDLNHRDTLEMLKGGSLTEAQF